MAASGPNNTELVDSRAMAESRETGLFIASSGLETAGHASIAALD
jgi:hypothetical protein